MFTSPRLLHLRPSVPFYLWRQSGAHTGQCSDHRVDKPYQRDIGDVLVAVSETPVIAQAKSGTTYTRMRMYTSASVLSRR